jgi:hypothetical protein
LGFILALPFASLLLFLGYINYFYPENPKISYKNTLEEWEQLSASLNQVCGKMYRKWSKISDIDKEHLLTCFAFANEIGRMCQEVSPLIEEGVAV